MCDDEQHEGDSEYAEGHTSGLINVQFHVRCISDAKLLFIIFVIIL